MRAARTARSLACALGLVWLSACATSSSVTIRSVEPGDVELGGVRHLVILDGEGRRSAREFVFQELARQARKDGYFTVEDRSQEGHQVKVSGRRAELDGGRRRMPVGQAGLRIDVLEWSTERELRAVTRQDEQGDKLTEHVPVRHGKVVLGVSLFDEQGLAHMAERDFEGRSELKTGATRQAALEDAARDAVARVLEQVTPRAVSRQVPLDGQDAAQKPILEQATRGELAQAAEAATRYFQANPQSPSAAYNLAVLLDALGRYEQALSMYDRALSLGGQDYYHEARAGCARRLSARRALANGPVPASLSDDSLR